MKVYTGRGDKGETSLFSGQRVPKDSLRVEAYGTVDELNSWLGLLLAQWPQGEPWGREKGFLHMVQRRLFVLGGEFANPAGGRETIGEADVIELEGAIDRLSEEAPPLKKFILPGGTPLAAAAQVARTVVRRAERLAVALHREAGVSPESLAYLNRLSDYLFVLGRWVNRKQGREEETV